MADNVALPALTGTCATDDIGGVQYQRVKPTWGSDGVATDTDRNTPLPVTQAVDPTDLYYINIPSQVHVAVANTVHFDFFNADAALLVRVMSIRQIPNITTAVTGIVFDWKLARTTAVGTGGTVLTPWLADTAQAAVDADITSRSKPTGGATEGTILWNYSLSSEETSAATIQIASQGGLELIPAFLQQNGQGVLLRQNQGLRVVQITSSNAGNTGWLVGFTQE